MGNLLACLAGRMGIHLLHTSAYRPSANGAVERFNGTLVRLLTKWVIKGSGSKWDAYLPWAVFAYRTEVHRVLGKSPFEVLYGQKPRTVMDFLVPGEDLDEDDYRNHVRDETEVPENERLRANERVSFLRETHERARKILNDVQDGYEKHLHKLPVFQVGDKVWVYHPHVRPDDVAQGKTKFTPHWLGIYTVLARASDVVYRVRSDKDTRDECSAHVGRMRLVGDPKKLPANKRKAVLGRASPQRPDGPPDALILDLDDERELEHARNAPDLKEAPEYVVGETLFPVRSIVGHEMAINPHTKRLATYYQVRYVNSPIDGWLLKSQLKQCQALLRQYEASRRPDSDVSSTAMDIAPASEEKADGVFVGVEPLTQTNAAIEAPTTVSHAFPRLRGRGFYGRDQGKTGASARMDVSTRAERAARRRGRSPLNPPDVS